MRRLLPRAFALATVTVLAAAFFSGTGSAAPLNETHALQNQNSFRCLTAQGNANNAPAFQYTCDGLVDQAWTFVPYNGTGGMGFEIENINSGKCLVTQGTNPNMPAFQYDCAGFPDSAWIKDDELNGQYELRNLNSGLCLLVQGFDNGTQAMSYYCDGLADELWSAP